MFNISQKEVRIFFCEVYRKQQVQEILSPLETIANSWLIQHPEYEGDLKNVQIALNTDYSIENGRTNPFLHLSMHLSITEQILINQPVGISNIANTLRKKMNSEHQMHHQIMNCLEEMVWNSQHNGLPLDSSTYIKCIKKYA